MCTLKLHRLLVTDCQGRGVAHSPQTFFYTFTGLPEAVGIPLLSLCCVTYRRFQGSRPALSSTNATRATDITYVLQRPHCKRRKRNGQNEF